MNPKLLIIEDDQGLCGQYRWAFPGLDITFAPNRTEALAAAARERPQVAMLDLGLPPDADGVSEGFATLDGLLKRAPELKVVVVTSHDDRANALRAIGAGAYDFCDKAMDIALLRTIVDRALQLRGLEDENRALIAGPTRIRNIVTAAENMLKLCRDIEKIAATHVTVLLLGESGTGKEALARALHDLGPRAKQPFVAINCGAIPENLLESELFGHERGAFTGAVKQSIGKIETANKGTLFLDEIGDLPHPLQVKLLRFLQEQVVERVGGRAPIPVDVRVVSATNLSLDQGVEQGRFRGDLLYRINPVTVRVPPLRDRPGDPVLLGRYFLARFAVEFGRPHATFADDAIAALSVHAWPGNVRELENRVKRAVVMADTRLISASDLELAPPAGEIGDYDLRAARLRAEREVLQRALARSNGTMATAARLLGISRPTLYGMLDTHGLSAGVAVSPD